MNHKGAKHINWNQRLTLERMLKNGFSKPQIAAALGKCLQSIYNEIERGMCEQMTPDYEFVKKYSPETAERRYQEYLRLKGPGVKMRRNCPLAKQLETLIVNEGYSPGAALAKIRNSGEKYDTEICETTLYNYIYRGDVFVRLKTDHLGNGQRDGMQGLCISLDCADGTQDQDGLHRPSGGSYCGQCCESPKCFREEAGKTILQNIQIHHSG